jgi:hypothetical protein
VPHYFLGPNPDNTLAPTPTGLARYKPSIPGGFARDPYRTNADARLPRAPLGGVEGGDGIAESRNGADVRPQSSVPHPLDDLSQLGTIRLDNKVDRPAVVGSHLRRSDGGHQRSAASNQVRGPLADLAADDIEHQIDAANIFQRVAV